MTALARNIEDSRGPGVLVADARRFVEGTEEFSERSVFSSF